MKSSLSLAVLLLTLSGLTASAQPGLEGAKLDISSIDLTGASSLHRLTLSVGTNSNAISATGVRYDTASGQVSFDPAAGTAVTSLDGSSFGSFVSTTNTSVFNKTLRNLRTRTNVVVTLTNTFVTTISPFGIFLDDSSQIKGSLASTSWTRQDARLNWSGTPIFTTRSGGGSRAKLEGAIAFGEKTGNFSTDSD